MAFRMGKISMLRLSDYKKFDTRVRKCFTKHDGVLLHVAQDLDVGASTVKRWLREDEKLKGFVTKVRARVAKAA